MLMLVIARQLWWTNQNWSETDGVAQRIRNGRSASVDLLAQTTRIKDKGPVLSHINPSHIVTSCFITHTQYMCLNWPVMKRVHWNIFSSYVSPVLYVIVIGYVRSVIFVIYCRLWYADMNFLCDAHSFCNAVKSSTGCFTRYWPQSFSYNF
jgi:hypothetical protein